MAEENYTLALHIAGGGYDDFYPYELKLEEGFSLVYSARLLVLSEKKRNQDDMRKLLGLNASLGISERLYGSTVTRSRALHGFITHVRSEGAFEAGEHRYCYKYCLVIEGEMAKLALTLASAPWYFKTPIEIAHEILDRYHIQAIFSHNYIDNSKYSHNLMFEQSRESDLGFLLRILKSYGVSFTSVHPIPQAKDGLASAEITFSDGNAFPVPCLAYSDKREPPQTQAFDFLKMDESGGIERMESFSAESQIQFEGIQVLSSYPNANYGSSKWQRGKTDSSNLVQRYNSLFNGYNHGISVAEVDGDTDLILDVLWRSREIAQEIIQGAAHSLFFMPGNVFSLDHFWGPDDATEIKAIVIRSRLLCRRTWPRNLLGNSSQARSQAETEELKVEFDCMDYGAQANRRYCGG